MESRDEFTVTFVTLPHIRIVSRQDLVVYHNVRPWPGVGVKLIVDEEVVRSLSARLGYELRFRQTSPSTQPQPFPQSRSPSPSRAPRSRSG